VTEPLRVTFTALFGVSIDTEAVLREFSGATMETTPLWWASPHRLSAGLWTPGHRRPAEAAGAAPCDSEAAYRHVWSGSRSCRRGLEARTSPALAFVFFALSRADSLLSFCSKGLRFFDIPF